MRPIMMILFLLSFSFPAFSNCLGTPTSFTSPDPRDQSPWTIPAREYLPNQTASPVLFILPTILGESNLERSVALNFCRTGFAVYILNTVRPVPRETTMVDWAKNDFILIRAKVAVGTAIDALTQRGNVSESFGILGLSLGAIQSAYVHGSEPRIKASIIVTGAGNMAGIQAYSQQSEVTAERINRMKILGINDPAVFAKLMSENIREDPLNVAFSIPTDSTYLFIALKDTSVPTVYQQELRQAISNPVVKELNQTHGGGIQEATSTHFQAMLSFLKKRL